MSDPKITTLIRPPRICFTGFDWSRTDKLRPTGQAQTDRILAAKLTLRVQ